MNIIQSLLSAISPLPDGDLSDRINYCYTSTLLIVCSAFVSGWRLAIVIIKKKDQSKMY